uniref:Uncharacterized protein n=1 Tax=Arundo donax TaxID=35708 RepID=A0A0A9D951_ARUDO
MVKGKLGILRVIILLFLHDMVIRKQLGKSLIVCFLGVDLVPFDISFGLSP